MSTTKPPKPAPVRDGDTLVYDREDSGKMYPDMGLLLEHGEKYVVGEDLDKEFGQALVDDGVCKVKATAKSEDKPAEKPADDEKSAPADADKEADKPAK